LKRTVLPALAEGRPDRKLRKSTVGLAAGKAAMSAPSQLRAVAGRVEMSRAAPTPGKGRLWRRGFWPRCRAALAIRPDRGGVGDAITSG